MIAFCSFDTDPKIYLDGIKEKHFVLNTLGETKIRNLQPWRDDEHPLSFTPGEKYRQLVINNESCLLNHVQRLTYVQRFTAWFIRRISAESNAFETIDNEMICFIIFCLNCIRRGRNATYEPGLNYKFYQKCRVI